MQTRYQSVAESCVNIAIGYIINQIANFIVFPMFGYHLTFKKNLMIGLVYTVIALARQYMVRRWFNKEDK